MHIQLAVCPLNDWINFKSGKLKYHSCNKIAVDAFCMRAKREISGLLGFMHFRPKAAALEAMALIL